jgi:dethiobiotin synthetase
MSGTLIVTGTDTGIGKTVVAAGLAAALGTHYWKPIQAGTEEGTDSAEAVTLGVPAEKVLPEAYRLGLPASPHLAAETEGVAIDLARLALPEDRPLIVEGAGGLMVPIHRAPPFLMIDLFARWATPVLLVARAGLGTINHSLLSIEALKARGVPLAGLIFVGEGSEDNIAVVTAFAGARSFGRLPHIDRLDAERLGAAMRKHIDLAGLRAAMGIAA